MNVDKILIRNINKSGDDLKKTFDKLASGLRINKAADDPAGLAVAEKIKVATVILSQGSKNIDYGTSAISIADGALEQIGNIDQRQAELATQAANGTYSDSQRASLNQEFQALSQERDRIAQSTEFNGQKLLTDSSVSIPTGSGDPISVDFSSIPSSGGSDISTQAGARAAIDQIKSNINTSTQSRADLGASESRLESEKNAAETRILSLQNAESRIRDADIASVAAERVAADIRQKSSTALAAQNNQSKGRILDLLG